MSRDEDANWEITTLGRKGAPVASSGSVRALSLDPDRYAITDVLGEGGMGEVRRCRDSVLNRDVALKAVRPGADVGDFEARFMREARVQARLAHPAIVPVYDAARDANGRVYFTMKRLEGVTIDEVIQASRRGEAKPYDRRKLITAFARACLAVDYAHVRGVLHRDLKPANLMLGAFGEVYVLDWGLAKIVGTPDDDFSISAERLIASREGDTERGVTMGTPAYMSPEQAAARALDARADVFALGAILYEILTSELLMTEAIILALRSKQRPLQFDSRPSKRGMGDAELDAIVVRATALDANDRYPTARALHDAVEAYLAADDDQRRCQRLAAAHVERAKAKSGDSERAAALEELGAALALAPEDDVARAHLVQLLRHPPKAAPVEVAQRAVEHEIARLRQMQKSVAILYLVLWLGVYPLLALAAGIRDPLEAALVPGAWTLAAALTLVHYFTNSRPTKFSWPGAAGALAIAVTSFIWGPMFIVPGLAVVVLFGQLLVARKVQRAPVVFLTCAAVAVPSYLAMRGYIDVYVPVGIDAFEIHGAIQVSRNAFYAGVLLAHLGQTLFGARFAARYRDVLDARVLENALFSWQLTNLVPRNNKRTKDDPESSRRRLTSTLPLSDDALYAAIDHDVDEAIAATEIDADAPERLRYTRIAHIGSTEHTEVWRCVDRRLGREVDMHIARSEKDNVPALAHARVGGRVEHPAVAPLYDAGTEEHGRVYYTTKHVRGLTFSRALDVAGKSERALRRLLSSFGQVCLAVAFAHERRVFHGSLSAQKILLGGFGEVYVAGWSMAANSAENDVARLREILALVGVPELDRRCKRVVTPRDIHEAIEAHLLGSRDVEVRVELAAAHLARANDAAARAFGGRGSFADEARARVVALAEVGRAVRLAPEDQVAKRLLLRLLTEPPSRPPPEVQGEVESAREQRARGPARATAMFGAIWLVLYPVIAMLVGVRHLAAVAIIWSAWALAVGVMAVMLWKRRWTNVPWPMLSTMFAGIVTSALVGPFFFTPIIGAFATMSFVLTVAPGWRRATMFLGSLITIAPIVLAWTHIHAAGDVVGDVLLSNGALGSMSYPTTLLVLTTMHLLGLLFAAEYASRFRDRLDTVENAYLMRLWQLAKLIRA